MRRGALLFILVELPSRIACSAAAVFSRPATTHILRRVPPSRYAEQARGKTAVLAMQHIFKLRGRLLYISARAAFAASAGSYLFPGPVESHWNPQSDSDWLGSSRPVTRVASVASSTGVGRTSATSRRCFHAGSLVETSEGKYHLGPARLHRDSCYCIELAHHCLASNHDMACSSSWGIKE